MPLATTTADAKGRMVLAARRLTTAATPAGAMDGMITTGHHIILLPKLAPSCSLKISAAGNQRTGGGQAGQTPFEPSCPDVVYGPPHARGSRFGEVSLA